MQTAEFHAMLNTPEYKDALLEAVHTVIAYNADIDASREAIKDKLDELCGVLKIEKAEAADVKRYVKKAATVCGKQQVDDLLNDQSAIEMLIAEIDGKMSQ